MNASVTLRPVAPADDEFLCAVYGSTRQQELAMTPWSEEQRAAFVRFQFTAQQRHFQTEYPQAEHSVILLADQPIGRLYVDRRADELRILDITLLPAERGQGIGTPIIRGLMGEAARAGKDVGIELNSFEQSHGLFARLGFAPTQTNGFHTLYIWRHAAGEESAGAATGPSSALT